MLFCILYLDLDMSNKNKQNNICWYEESLYIDIVALQTLVDPELDVFSYIKNHLFFSLRF